MSDDPVEQAKRDALAMPKPKIFAVPGRIYKEYEKKAYLKAHPPEPKVKTDSDMDRIARAEEKRKRREAKRMETK